MKRSPNGPRFHPADLRDPNAAHDALLHWDELDDRLLRALADDPTHRGRLDKLQRADAWLRARAAQKFAERETEGAKAPGPDLLKCPPADELYDFAAGPGATPLAPERYAAIDRHMATCLECEQLVATLAVPPPSPILLGLDPEPEFAVADETAIETAPELKVLRGGRAPRRRFTLVALAAAAGLVLAAGIWQPWSPSADRWPPDSQLRGNASEALLFPRDRVLEKSADLVALFPALGESLLFEAEPRDRATQYRFELGATRGGAFERFVPTRSWTSSTSVSPAKSTATENALEPGFYTWKVWARLGALDVDLGARDFEIVADPAIVRELRDLAARGGSSALIAAVDLLHARGYRTDARTLARSLPISPERDHYLGRPPGR